MQVQNRRLQKTEKLQEKSFAWNETQDFLVRNGASILHRLNGKRGQNGCSNSYGIRGIEKQSTGVR